MDNKTIKFDRGVNHLFCGVARILASIGNPQYQHYVEDNKLKFKAIAVNYPYLGDEDDINVAQELINYKLSEMEYIR